MNLKKRKASKVRRLHRSLGAGAAIFVIFMVLSGLAINHSNGLGLDQRHVSQSFLLDWYGLGKLENIHSFAVGDDWQSIYRFAGADIEIMTHFSNHFGATSQSYLTQTYRSFQGIVDVAATFVQRNEDQLKKSVSAAKDIEKDQIR